MKEAAPDGIRLFDFSDWATRHRWTHEQLAVVERLTSSLAQSRWATAGFLVGSLARGTNDDHSDVDFHVVADPRVLWRPLVAAAMPSCYVGDFGRAHEPGFPLGVFGLTARGQKFDIFVHDPAEFDLSSLYDHFALFDTPTSRFDVSRVAAPGTGFRYVAPYYPKHAVDTFYLAIESLCQLLARGERYLAFRNCHVRMEFAWVTLLLAESGVERYLIGKRRLVQFLTEDQISLLDWLIALPTTSVGALADHASREVELFRDRSRKLAAATGSSWPDHLAGIVEEKLEQTRSRLGSQP